jgi:UDP-2,3-diacylglucosamine hydrolase
MPPPAAGAVLLLADLHLPPGPSSLRERFIAFLRGPAADAQSVYILGDLFEYWIGDDVGLEVYAEECATLRERSAAGTTIGFMHGNRDFLVGRRFAATTGVRLLKDPLKLELGGIPTLLSHGDRYCIADAAYQRWRRFARNPVAQAGFLALPRRVRERIAGDLRHRSGDAQRGKASDITDVTPSAIERELSNHGCRRMIHGHTHRPAEHTLSEQRERIVLADWRPQRCEYLRLEGSGFSRHRIPSV